MRRLTKQGRTPNGVAKKLTAQTALIRLSADQKVEADKLYNNARQTVWFKPVVKRLKKLAGKGQRCMYCSGSESSDVEHYQPKAVFPLLAMTWTNYLWICTPCNRHKGDRFPPDTEPGGKFINPLFDDVWQFFFIDNFGILTPRFDVQANALDPRAVSTRDFIELNREAVLDCRLARLKDLKEQVKETIRLLKTNQISKQQARRKITAWKTQPFQPDVADYFLNGPGSMEAPFKELLRRVV